VLAHGIVVANGVLPSGQNKLIDASSALTKVQARDYSSPKNSVSNVASIEPAASDGSKISASDAGVMVVAPLTNSA
jgi:hypothetical protein